MVLSKGNLGVDVFLFLSAIGLSKSMETNNIKDFYKHRFYRVVLPFFLIAIPFFIWLDFIQLQDGVLPFVFNVTTLNYWLTGNHPTWYIAFIIIMYFLFPILYRWDNKTNHVSTVLLLFLSVVSEYFMFKLGFFLYNTSERALSRVPVFMIGLLSAESILSCKKIKYWELLMWLFVGLWSFIMISLYPPQIVVLRYIYCPIAISIIVCYAFFRKSVKLDFLWKFLAWIGGISLELYVVHVLVIRFIKVTDTWSFFQPLIWWILIPLISLPLALILQNTTEIIIKGNSIN